MDRLASSTPLSATPDFLFEIQAPRSSPPSLIENGQAGREISPLSQDSSSLSNLSSSESTESSFSEPVSPPPQLRRAERPRGWTEPHLAPDHLVNHPAKGGRYAWKYTGSRAPPLGPPPRDLYSIARDESDGPRSPTKFSAKHSEPWYREWSDIVETEESFHNRPTIKLPISDLLKGLLVDDWENITNKNQLVPIPHHKPVNVIFDDYLDHERKRREEGSAELDILEETIDGLRQYFNKALGHILLYRFERIQWHDIVREIRDSDENSSIRCAADAYGAEHLARLLCALEELIAHTNMDQQSVNRLREELAAFIAWFTANFTTYFSSNYETPSQDYIERARGY